ncbi:hypothetical protein [Microbacterium azadirachtae]|uniref:hypothetical protein n=1 Tax=Microbacterium azadirachtae TaxID=582680 RepID=UPI0012E0695A|nr:hypothetical protein [Microbacterium azadirachtae]
MTTAKPISAIESAANELVARHEILRTSFETPVIAPAFSLSVDQRPTQVARETSSAVVETTAALSLDSIEARHAREARADPFAQSGPAIRIGARELDCGGSEAIITVGHMFADGAGMHDLKQDLRALLDTRPLKAPVHPIDVALLERSSEWVGRSERNLAHIEHLLHRHAGRLSWAAQPSWAFGRQYEVKSSALAECVSVISNNLRISPASVVIGAIGAVDCDVSGHGSSLIRSLFTRPRPGSGLYLAPHNLNAFIEVDAATSAASKSLLIRAHESALRGYRRTEYDVTRLAAVQAAVAEQNDLAGLDRFLILNFLDDSAGSSINNQHVEVAEVIRRPAVPYTYAFVDYIRRAGFDQLKVTCPIAGDVDPADFGSRLTSLLARWRGQISM